ncbi:multiple sugar transport system permease protein [Cryobacterium mesophilum]|uniref:Carbohydrate ABC transporter permease n=1 Tax=Terrimesophilobacter mesophilus TaxID=433647 RepID=A0A4R8VA33_9MICO|nr:carbohydrate ABC transporter permease [Terrimesophilobacter mesophilus]MBB5632815.1 multiple sugar transport system permease protein [Terrimesophilobacter mesophilus]TFB79603.1 carbohydrate ABC transporter permease [Terrimesophilobacter mesophilus]
MTSPAVRMSGSRRAHGRGSEAKRYGSHLFAHIVLVLGGFAMALPFLWQIIMSLSSNAEVTSVPPTFFPRELRFDNYLAVFDVMPFFSQLGVSIWITVIRVVVQIILCTFAGYAFARMRFRGRGLMLALVLAILMVPSQVYLLSQYQIVQNLGLLDTVAGIVAPGLFSAFGTFLMRQFFLGLPVELEEAARLDGANPFQIFWKIMLPLTGPAVSALAILVVLFSWNELLWPLVVSTRSDAAPLSVGLAALAGVPTVNYPVLMAASVLTMAPILILFIILQRRVIEGLAFTGIK